MINRSDYKNIKNEIKLNWIIDTKSQGVTITQYSCGYPIVTLSKMENKYDITKLDFGHKQLQYKSNLHYVMMLPLIHIFPDP